MRKNLRKLIPLLTAGFLVLIAYLLYENLSSINWNEVRRAWDKISFSVAGISLSLSFLIYSILSSYDFLSFHYLKLKDKINMAEVLIRAYTCYAFNLSLGSWVGGLAVRYRVYSRWKISLDRIPYIIAISTLTNWLGYTFIVGNILTFFTARLSGLIPLQHLILRSLGIILLLGVGFYFWNSFNRKVFYFRGEEWIFPSPTFSGVQLFFSTFQWGLQSLIIYLLLDSLDATVPYPKILFTFMISSLVAVFTHIPAGLGVLEVVFMRSRLDIPHPDLLVALIIYRLVYYFIPLIIALPIYAYLELRRKQRTQ